jgi:hypothetical protein
MVYRSDRLVWAAVLFRTTRPEVVEGAIIRRSERLHWTRDAAVDEVHEWVKDLPQVRPDSVVSTLIAHSAIDCSRVHVAPTPEWE